MSTESRRGPGVTADATRESRAFRLLAMGGVLVLTGSYVTVLLDVTAVVGGTRRLVALVVAMIATATVLARAIRPRTATVAAVALGGVGFAYYFTAAGLGVGVVFSATWELLSDSVAFATGLSVFQMIDVGTWTLGFVPAPVFLSWYLGLRRRYVASVVAGGTALTFLVLTGDAPTGTTALGTVGGLAAVGFGELERRDGTVAQTDVLAILFATMLLLSTTVTLVPGPGDSSDPTFLVDGDSPTLEGTTTNAPQRVEISGSVELSPEVRFTVHSERAAYWRTGVYDRYTGDGWVRTGQTESYGGELPSPPGEAETVQQTVRLQGPAEVMPAAAHPIAVGDDAASNTEVTVHGGIRPDEPLAEGDTYRVESAVVDPSAAELRTAGTDYPADVTDRYLQLPEGTSSAFETRTQEITGDAETPYEKAVAIERHLELTKGYSLDVERPDGAIEEAFLLEMDEGYCVYFATTMVQMLRAEDVPARYAVGYTTGQQVADDEWVVRGLDAHAWVEVYFPDYGWVAFDPTPGSAREQTHAARLEQAREEGVEDVDTNRSEAGHVANASAGNLPDEADRLSERNQTDASVENGSGLHAEDPRNLSFDSNGTANNSSADDPDAASDADRSTDDGFEWPGVEQTAFGLALLVGFVAGAHRTGVIARASHELRLHWRGRRRDPDRDVERAYRRLELLLEREYRPRRRSESTRQYLSALSANGLVDSRVWRVGRLYERARYGDGVDREEADEAVHTVDAIVRDRTPIVRRFRR